MASFGENLRRERELRGVDLRAIADATKISYRFLQALEQDRIHILPGGIFRRAFVREYARFLGLDEERTVAEFLYAHAEEAPARDVEKPVERPFPVGAVAVGVVLGVGILLSFLRSPARTPREAAATPAVATVRSPEHPPAVPTPEPAAARPEEEGLTLTLSAKENCWVSAQVDGRTVLNRVLGEGETTTLEAAGEIVLSVGNAGGLSFRVNDKNGVPLGRAGEVKRNIVITKKSLPSLVQDSPDRPAHSS